MHDADLGMALRSCVFGAVSSQYPRKQRKEAHREQLFQLVAVASD
jgi:hypothetical protein